MGKVVNKKDLAEIIGVTERTLTDWQKEEGFPMLVDAARGHENQYDVTTVIQWMIDREVRKISRETQRDRLARLQGDKMEIELAKENGTLIPASEIEPTWQSRVLTAAAFMASRHSRLAGMLEATPGIEAKRQMLKQEDAAFLTRLGVDGERMQAEVEALLQKVSTVEASTFLKRLAANDDTPHTPDGPASGLGEVRPSGEGPPV